MNFTDFVLFCNPYCEPANKVWRLKYWTLQKACCLLYSLESHIYSRWIVWQNVSQPLVRRQLLGRKYDLMFYILTVRELRSSGWYAVWWVTSYSATEKEIYALVKNFMLLSILKKLLPRNIFILQTLSSSSCMFSRWTIKHPLLLPTLPRSVGLSSPTSPVYRVA
jgi:hypothetical protein